MDFLISFLDAAQHFLNISYRKNKYKKINFIFEYAIAICNLQFLKQKLTTLLFTTESMFLSPSV